MLCMHACAPAEVAAAFKGAPLGLIMIQRPVPEPAPSPHRLISISRRRGSSINCTCQVELGSQGVMAAQRPHTASPASAENYSTTCHFYCVVITESHRQTLTIHCLLWRCGGVNLRSGEISSTSLGPFNTQPYAFIAGAGNCLSPQRVVRAGLLCTLCCRGSSVDVRLSRCHAALI